MSFANLLLLLNRESDNFIHDILYKTDKLKTVRPIQCLKSSKYSILLLFVLLLETVSGCTHYPSTEYVAMDDLELLILLLHFLNVGIRCHA